MTDYWESRKTLVYLQHIFAIVHFIGKDAKSIIDVGSNGCPYLEWFDWIPRRVSVDLVKPYSSGTVEGIKADFLTLNFKERFDVCLCLQVIEHVEDAHSFSRGLLTLASRVLVSVPYCWPKGASQGHVHDPVDEAKVADWFGRPPDFTMISTEHGHPVRRMLCYFEQKSPSFLSRLLARHYT